MTTPLVEQTPSAELCSDPELGYERSRTRFEPGIGLALDESYRLAHLPLVAPHHPRVIPSRDGAFYSMGRHPQVFSLVLPIPSEALLQSQAYQELEAKLQAAPFSSKIAWDLLARRRTKLHATVCGSLAIGGEPPLIAADRLRELAGLGPIRVELRGLFSGNVNVGRLYLKVYPERRDGANLLQRVQQVLGRRQTDLYVVGVWNLTDDLDPAEADALRALIEEWWDRPILRFQASDFWLLGAMDDLVLDGAVAQVVGLTRE